MFTDEQLEKATDDFFKEYSSPSEGGGESPAPKTPVDIYREKQNARYDESKKLRPNGASADMKMSAKAIIDGIDGRAGIAPAYKRAKSQVEGLKARGDVARSRMAMEQYMQEVFLPAVETLVKLNSVDELINAKSILSELDKYAMVDGGPSNGYTASYLRQLYGEDMGNIAARSDSFVMHGVREMIGLVDACQIRTAIGRAKRLKDMIDRGEHMASDEDYEIIEKVALRGQ